MSIFAKNIQAMKRLFPIFLLLVISMFSCKSPDEPKTKTPVKKKVITVVKEKPAIVICLALKKVDTKVTT